MVIEQTRRLYIGYIYINSGSDRIILHYVYLQISQWRVGFCTALNSVIIFNALFSSLVVLIKLVMRGLPIMDQLYEYYNLSKHNINWSTNNIKLY